MPCQTRVRCPDPTILLRLPAVNDTVLHAEQSFSQSRPSPGRYTATEKQYVSRRRSLAGKQQVNVILMLRSNCTEAVSSLVWFDTCATVLTFVLHVRLGLVLSPAVVAEQLAFNQHVAACISSGRRVLRHGTKASQETSLKRHSSEMKRSEHVDA